MTTSCFLIKDVFMAMLVDRNVQSTGKLNEMSTLERAIAIAVEAHSGQVDKAGSPYILHPLRVMLSLQSNNERIVGVLHDVCEDCPGWDLGRFIREGFPENVIDALRSVTKIEGESYEDFVLRASRNEIGRAVKIADLVDNSDISRIHEPTDRDHKRLAKYARALAALK
jgi:(p)ppGpp synthase/HD superfamily hydrolase